MFSALILICSLSSTTCINYTPTNDHFINEQSCHRFARAFRKRFLDIDDNRSVDYRCINWGEGA